MSLTVISGGNEWFFVTLPERLPHDVVFVVCLHALLDCDNFLGYLCCAAHLEMLLFAVAVGIYQNQGGYYERHFT